MLVVAATLCLFQQIKLKHPKNAFFEAFFPTERNPRLTDSMAWQREAEGECCVPGPWPLTFHMESRWLDPSKVSVLRRKAGCWNKVDHREMNYGKKFGVLPKMFSKKRKDRKQQTRENTVCLCVWKRFLVSLRVSILHCVKAPDCSTAVGFTQIHSAKL